MKTFSILAVTTALLGAAIAAAGLPLTVTALGAIGCAAGLVALFVHDYGRFRRRHLLRLHRATGVRPIPRRLAIVEARATGACSVPNA